MRQNGAKLFRWMMRHLPFFQDSGRIWYLGTLQSFFLSIIRNGQTMSSTISSISNSSYHQKMDRQKSAGDNSIKGQSSANS
jgi:hypothetical protein